MLILCILSSLAEYSETITERQDLIKSIMTGAKYVNTSYLFL
jgi:hypothetical protein